MITNLTTSSRESAGPAILSARLPTSSNQSEGDGKLQNSLVFALRGSIASELESAKSCSYSQADPVFGKP